MPSFPKKMNAADVETLRINLEEKLQTLKNQLRRLSVRVSRFQKEAEARRDRQRALALRAKVNKK